MTWIEAMLLGIVQGLTEFLPVSSSGHLEIGSVVLGVAGSNNLLFAVFVHAATAMSTVIVFWKDIRAIVIDLFKLEWNESTQFSSKIVLSMIPVAIVGVLFEKEIESFFTGNLVLVGSMLLVTGALLSFTFFKKSGNKSVSYFSALIIGVAQAFAILPGISRSGATIATGILLGVDKEKATRFSFLMVLIPILGAGMLKLKGYLEAPIKEDISLFTLIVGFLAALISGYIACKWMINIVKKGKLVYFAIYCFVVAFIALGVGLA